MCAIPSPRTLRTVALALVLGLIALGCADASPTADSAGTSTADTVDASSDAAADEAGPTAPATSDHPPMPSVALTTFEDGEPIDLRDFVGTPLVVNFWASWCPPCAAEMPDFEAVSQLAGDRVDFVGINISDSQDLAEELAERTGVTYDLVSDPDGEAFVALRGIGMPTTVFVDAAGGIVSSHTGLLTQEALIADIEEHLGVDVSGDVSS
jgi:cytochrome c biogenesis protein CcmG, thiol:disulfide interchange protein DsbE